MVIRAHVKLIFVKGDTRQYLDDTAICLFSRHSLLHVLKQPLHLNLLSAEAFWPVTNEKHDYSLRLQSWVFKKWSGILAFVWSLYTIYKQFHSRFYIYRGCKIKARRCTELGWFVCSSTHFLWCKFTFVSEKKQHENLCNLSFLLLNEKPFSSKVHHKENEFRLFRDPDHSSNYGWWKNQLLFLQAVLLAKKVHVFSIVKVNCLSDKNIRWW